MFPTPHPFQVGDRVRLTAPFERYPFCLIDAGATGTVTEASYSATDPVLAVRWDETVPGLEEWGNEGIWCADDIAHGDLPQDSLERA